MKYIRTKDGIYEVICFDDKNIIPSPIIKMGNELTHILDYKKCKQADTIEELCDELVGKRDNEYTLIEKGLTCKQVYENIKSWQKLTKRSMPVVYGAIWTDKGLIYVAKLNDKGELVLI